jgi:hypothetical protein
MSKARRGLALILPVAGNARATSVSTAGALDCSTISRRAADPAYAWTSRPIRRQAR